MISKKYLVALMMMPICGMLCAQPAFQNISNNPEAMAMGNTDVVAKASAFSIYSNSSATVFAENKFSAGISYMGWQPDALKINIGSFSGFYKINNKMSVLLDIRAGICQSQDIINHNGQVTGSFTPRDICIGAGYVYKLTDFLAVGANFHYLNSRIYKKDASAFAGDVSIFFKQDRLNAGLVFNNFGSEFKFESRKLKQNMQIKAGVGYDFLSLESNHQLNGAASIGYVSVPNNNGDKDGSVLCGAGFEYGFKNMLFARAGYNYSDSKVFTPQHISVGIGAKLIGIGINAAYIIPLDNHSVIKNTFSVGLSYSL